ncbi:hypothetical protein [Aquimarina litoralis]|uniref:hypothetical protein n=1 Tax=Aquimarina litoralis TaxID=584605 RepID=UPI001C58D8CB|nr:hypothetical protein [Aquimarina litoralis]MBW1294150.1 hypothetical protein [Aquimarina litoralis]
MKFKLLTIIFGISTILLGLLAGWFYLDLNAHAKVVQDRELTITNYQKVINAMGRSGTISVDRLKKELQLEFKIDDEIGYNDFSKEYYYALFPKDHKVNSTGIWDFMGLELILDDQKEFKTVQMYKP